MIQAKPFQDVARMLIMKSLVFRKDEAITEVYHKKLIQHVHVDIIDKLLKGHWGIAQSEGHHQVFR